MAWSVKNKTKNPSDFTFAGVPAQTFALEDQVSFYAGLHHCIALVSKLLVLE